MNTLNVEQLGLILMPYILTPKLCLPYVKFSEMRLQGNRASSKEYKAFSSSDTRATGSARFFGYTVDRGFLTSSVFALPISNFGCAVQHVTLRLILDIVT